MGIEIECMSRYRYDTTLFLFLTSHNNELYNKYHPVSKPKVVIQIYLLQQSIISQYNLVFIDYV